MMSQFLPITVMILDQGLNFYIAYHHFAGVKIVHKGKNLFNITPSTKNGQQSLIALQRCVISIVDWMTQAKLIRNPIKTESLLIGS